MTGIPELLVYLNYVCLWIEYNNDCYRDIRRTLNSTPGPSRPRTMHISWYKTSIPKMWTDLGKTKEKLRCTVIKYRLHRRVGCCMLPCYRSPGKKIIFGGSIFPARIELATFSVWGGRNNHYTTETTLFQTMVFDSSPRFWQFLVK